MISRNDHVKWKVNLKGLGSSTPVVWGGSLFVTAESPGDDGVVAIKVDVETGEIEWTRPVCTKRRNDRRSSMAGPSPATDGERVLFVSGGGEIACFDFSGTLSWRKNLEEEYGDFSLKWTYSSSPVIFEGVLYLQVLQNGESGYGEKPGRSSLLLALDPATGKEKWKHVRLSWARGQSMEAYSSPVPMVHQGRKAILVSGADCVTGHEVETGDEFWRWETWNRGRLDHWRTIPSPVYGDDMVVVCAPKGQPAYALFANMESREKVSFRWKSKTPDLSCDVTTPLFYDEYFYFLNGRKKILYRVEPFTGRIEWEGSLPSRAKIEASPTGADGKIYIISHTGEVFVVEAGTEYRLLHSTILGRDAEGRNRAPVVPADGRLFIRTETDLWCME